MWLWPYYFYAQNKKRQRYKPTINSKHFKCHESLTLPVDITFSLYAVTPKQPNATYCHTVSMVHISTDRKGDIMSCFLFFVSACEYLPFFTVLSVITNHDNSVHENAQCKLFIITLVLIGLSTQFKNWSIV